MSDAYFNLTQILDTFAQEDALEAVSVHGSLTFLALLDCRECPAEWLDLIWGDDLGQLPKANLTDWIVQSELLLADIVSALHDGTTPTLPFDSTLAWEDSDQQAWCVGFMMTLFAIGDRLPKHDGQAWAEALLPIEVGSGLFVEDAEFKPLYADAELLSSLLEQIPENLVDLFLLLNASVDDGSSE